MPDGSLDMVACSHDDQIGPHNMFFQHSSAITFGDTGAGTPHTMLLFACWNASNPVWVATGRYTFSFAAFDTVAALPWTAACVASSAVTTTTVSGVAYKHVYIIGVGATSAEVRVVRSDTGVLIDLENSGGVPTEIVNITLIGRRTTTTPFSAFGPMTGSSTTLAG